MDRTGEADIELSGEAPVVRPPLEPLPERARTPVEVQELRDEEDAEGAEPYFAPTDPVVNGRGRSVPGGFDETSMDSLEVDPSAIDEEPGDEALADAVRRELREDALTSGLAVDVQVRRGVVFLRGAAEDIDETDDVAEVASRVPGVRGIVEQMALKES